MKCVYQDGPWLKRLHRKQKSEAFKIRMEQDCRVWKTCAVGERAGHPSGFMDLLPITGMYKETRKVLKLGDQFGCCIAIGDYKQAEVILRRIYDQKLDLFFERLRVMCEQSGRYNDKS